MLRLCFQDVCMTAVEFICSEEKYLMLFAVVNLCYSYFKSASIGAVRSI